MFQVKCFSNLFIDRVSSVLMLGLVEMGLMYGNLLVNAIGLLRCVKEWISMDLFLDSLQICVLNGLLFFDLVSDCGWWVLVFGSGYVVWVLADE